MEWSGVVWSGVEWHCVMWSGIVWCGVEWHCVVWSGIVCHGVALCGVKWSGIVCSGVALCGVEWSGMAFVIVGSLICSLEPSPGYSGRHEYPSFSRKLPSWRVLQGRFVEAGTSQGVKAVLNIHE